MKYKTLLEQARAAMEKANGLIVDGSAITAETKAEFDKLMTQAEALQESATKLRRVEERDAELQETAAEQKRNESPAGEDKTFGSVYLMRFGEEEKGREQIMADLVGRDYRATIWQQNMAFAKYLRWGEKMLDTGDFQVLRKQIFPWTQIEHLVKNGMTVSQVKTTMVEAQGSLGGYAVPPNVQQEIITRLPGLTAVRGGGARVVELVNSNSIELPTYTGGTDRYRGALRGTWGSGETPTPGDKNATMGMETVVAHVYTYKVSMSQSLVEDAANLVDLVQSDIGDTLAIDEDEAFLIGDGAGKPRGILPSSTNADSLSEVVSGSGTALTAGGIKNLKRGVATQYRKNGKWIGNSDTFGDVEALVDGSGAYIFPDLSDTDMLLNRRVLESEALPDVASSAYPLIFGDLAGYYIVQKAGLTIVRMQDSNTGINKVEFHVRRRVGGRVAKPWMFAVQKVAAS